MKDQVAKYKTQEIERAGQTEAMTKLAREMKESNQALIREGEELRRQLKALRDENMEASMEIGALRQARRKRDFSD